MDNEERTIVDTNLKGVTLKLFWQFLAGWTTLIFLGLSCFFALKEQINNIGLIQGKTDAIQDMRIDAIKRDIEIQTLQIKDLNERYNELKSLQK